MFRMKVKTTLLKLLAFSVISAGASSAMAFEQDTHFQVTYIICRTAGFTAAESLLIAAADQGMDDSSGTVANGGVGGIIPNVKEEWLWHALDKGGDMRAIGVVQRKDRIFTAAENAPGKPLYLLGVFFHYQQDTWAHRHHYDGQFHSYDRYTTYNTPFGHAPAGHQPDRPPFDPGTAIMNIEDGLKYAKRYLTEVLHRAPRGFIANYQPVGPGSLQPNWAPGGPYYHQAKEDGGAGSPRRFFTDLIRAQINAYKSSSDPLYYFRHTADEADLNATSRNLQGVCNQYASFIGDTITIPTIAQKNSQGFLNMTTAQLLNAGLPD